MKNYVQPGETVTVVAPTGGAVSGVGVKVGSLFGVAAFDAAQGETVEIVTEGVFDLAKDGNSVTVGEKLYWNDVSKVVTVTASTNLLIGVALMAAAAGDATVRIRLTAAFTI